MLSYQCELEKHMDADDGLEQEQQEITVQLMPENERPSELEHAGGGAVAALAGSSYNFMDLDLGLDEQLLDEFQLGSVFGGSSSTLSMAFDALDRVPDIFGGDNGESLWLDGM